MHGTGGTHGSLAHPGSDLRFTGSHRSIKKFAEVGILRQAGCDDLSVPLAVFEYRLAKQRILVWVGNLIFTGGGRVIDDRTRKNFSAWLVRFSFGTYLLRHRL